MRRHKITGYVVAYVAIFATLGGTSYAAAGRTDPAADYRNGRPGRTAGPNVPNVPGGPDRNGGSDGAVDPTDPGGAVGTGNVGARARSTSSAVAKHGGATDIPLTGATWTQAADEVQLLAGTAVISNPGKCTGGFGNALTLSVDGDATTFAAVPPAFKAGTATVPFVIGTLSEPGRDTEHKLTAQFANSCSKNGEDYTVEDVKVDVLKFR
jgi:hypothetical protein